MSLKAIVMPAVREPAPFVVRVRAFTVAKVDSIGFVVRRCFQCSAGKSKCTIRRSLSVVSDSVALGYFAWATSRNAFDAAIVSIDVPRPMNRDFFTISCDSAIPTIVLYWSDITFGIRIQKP